MWFDASLQKFSIGNQKCDEADDDSYDDRDNEWSLCVDHASQATQKGIY